MRNLAIFSVALSVCLSSCCNGGQESSAVPVQDADTTVVTEVVQDTAVIVTETDDMRLYKPVFNGGVGLELKPDKSDNRIFMAAAAYTKSYDWTEFDHGLIAGPHIDGEFYEGYDEPANTGAFYYDNSSKTWGFAYFGYGETLKGIAASGDDVVAFSQVMLVYKGQMCRVHQNAKPGKPAFRRALCNIGGELYVIDSKHKVSMYDFAECLVSEGVLEALYMDMGSMRYSLYRETCGSDWIEIHPVNSRTKYCTNYLVFYHEL